MCIAFPGQVVAVDATGAVVETDGRRRRASMLYLPEIAVGDWVTVAAGTIVARLEPAEAAEVRALVAIAIRQPQVEEGVPDVHAT
jgi:hydrogenase assembly chaperone HypC/HupF